jgi:DNA-binding transcriptional MerR regulator
VPATTIGAVAREAGIAQSAIRYYEEEGLLPLPERVGGRRIYGPDVVDRLRVIRTARELGFSLEDIRTLLHGFSADTPPSQRWQQLAARKLLEVNALIQRATRMKGLLEKGLRCDCVTVDDCILHDCSPPVTLGRRRSA